MDIIHWSVELRFALALALGLLVGLEREGLRSEHHRLTLGGVRTYPLISLFGFGCAWLNKLQAGFMLPAGLLALAALAVLSYLAKMRESEKFGITTEISALLTFITGALALQADVWVAMALGVLNAFLLSEKAELENAVKHLDRVEFLAALKFLLVTLIILPVLPNQEYSRFHINPATVWKVVILVASVGFLGYILASRLGRKVGLWLSGLLGGIVSSTSVTVAASRLARQNPASAPLCLQAAILAASMMYIRLIVLVALLRREALAVLWWKLAFLAAAALLLTIRKRPAGPSENIDKGFPITNPFEIRPALAFAALFVLLSIISQWVKEYLGKSGLLTLAGVVGVADVDPFILSLVRNPAGFTALSAAAFLLALLSNTLFKGLYLGLAAPSLRRDIAWRYGLLAALHIPLICL
jgi:uncharacterized membrane protein (DUF4010 family)